jgi:mannose-6-phosphate isomerase-like protein (cupin superfamily)
MKVSRIEDYNGGWYIGNFNPAAYKTSGFEVSYKVHKQGEIWDWHYHEHLDEINFIVRGKMNIQGKTLVSGDIFILEPMEIADPEFLEDCEIVCIKSPNITNDKIVVKRIK